jgi:tRNA-2-methylthio-N6-dimethylallyladenosine synthase
MSEAESISPKNLYIHTFGCQMNESDSSRMAELLSKDGWRSIDDPEEADLILLNTCAIREKAEQKVLSALGRYRLVRNRRGTRLGVTGCVAQQEKQKLLERVPYLDFVLGPDQVAQLPAVVAKASGGDRVVETGWMDSEEYVFPRADPEASRGQVSAFVTVMKGCDNVCSFCVVPYTRGREVSRAYADVVTEVASLVAVGVREVTLIGQNVNSYAGGCTFAELIRRVAAVPAVERIRFTTSHPQDLSDELMQAFADVPQLMPHFHLPVQAGSNSVLERMRRRYTWEAYVEKLDRLRLLRPDIAMTSDIIVGFPGETDDDFEATMTLIERVGYANLFSFVYSPRPHTSAIRHEKSWGPVPHEVSVARLARLQQRQREITAAYHRTLVGRTLELLVEGPSRTDASRRMGRTVWNQVVNFDGRAPAGALARVHIDSATASALSGTEVDFLPPSIPVERPPARKLLQVVAAPAATSHCHDD